MASVALNRFNDEVDNSNLSPVIKEAIKKHGEKLFIATSKEAILHLIKHLRAISNDINELEENKNKANAMLSIINNYKDNPDAWWVSILRE